MQHSFGNHSPSNQRRERNKINPNCWKEDIKLSLFAHDMTLYLGNATTLPGNYWSSSMNSGYKKVSGYKIYIQKSVAFSYPNSKILEREIKEIIPFTIASKGIKYLGISLGIRQRSCTLKTKQCWLKKLRMTQNRWKDIPCSSIGRMNIVKMTTLPGNLHIQCNSCQITSGIYHRTKTIFFFLMCIEIQKALKGQSSLDKREWSWKNESPWLQTILTKL